ncbi:MAG: peptidylprolyl isomerase [Oceanospirillaceae bacterium]|mgnify:CR=1 FL=1|uniref:FKBP-type peptidyl-prolyl cis-trans isomerase n=1 Tax=unclassified Thalassolituus TaxID=2624967 RepID=UPI000C4FCC09|nr:MULTISPECIES: FKBP-type peptidyl-prolyl cis-trans isomerase [unclassified Thalassolituus]MAS24609.1 peptidylprolyl isomerase [Oceanospirillaceae bacterium]MBL35746.1 peptidylprolyl isomerase [Oceanospirillaceae bacterium]MBS52729.1 peptidylprolyl isomerase [Oceanospirillaceae bacterium]|tara:strand:- start:3438 stop:3881 length:444 start_codon:yes stop_codon:yes gene_type:complete
MSVAEIQQGSKVSMHFAIKLPDGQVVDSTFEKAPAEFAMGDGNLLPGFEEYLVGLVSGDHKEFAIPPEKGFGQPNPQNMQEMKLSDFPVDMPVAPGLMVSFADAQGSELPGVIHSVEGNWVTVDFNHPLAGKTLTFEVQILEVQDAD